MSTHGFNIDLHCSCGAVANLGHWLEGCPDLPPEEGTEADEGEVFVMNPSIWKPIQAPQAVSKHPYSIPICSEGGVPVEAAEFQWEEGPPIYTDGTAIHASFPEVSQAVAGAV